MNAPSIFVEESHALPLVDVSMRFAVGGELDPRDRTGLARLVARTMSMGPRGMSEKRTAEALAALGGRIAIYASRRAIRLQATVLSRHLDAFFALLARIVREPAFRAGDLARQKRETRALLLARRDDDGTLAHRHYRQALFGDHAYGRSLVGDARSIRRIGAADLRSHHERHLGAGSLLFGFAGDVTETQAQALVERHFSDLGGKARKRRRPAKPKQPAGRHVLIIDKPERTQTQVVMGTLGAQLGDPRLDGLIVSNTVFGGTFSSRLNHEVRTRLGYTYGAHSQVGRAEQREAWTMTSAPEAEHTVACVGRQLELLDAWVEGGVRASETKSAKQSLIGAYGFDIETAQKRLDIRLDRALFGLDPDRYRDYPKRIRQVTRKDASAAPAELLDPSRLTIVVVAEADQVGDGLAALPGVRSVRSVAFDAL